MKHFTSYYANYYNIPTDYICIGITAVCPDGFNNNICNFMYTKGNVLTPDINLQWRYKNNEIKLEDYAQQYISDIIQNIKSITKKPDFVSWITAVDNFYEYQCVTNWKGIVFMTYEKPGEFSHRHILRQMFNRYSIPCEEYGCKSFEVWGYTPEIRPSKILF